MAGKRRSFTPSFKAKVAREAVRDMKAISEITQSHKLHASQTNLWKKQLLEGAKDLFDDGRRKSGATTDADEPQSAELYQQIGRLKVEIEWPKSDRRPSLRPGIGSTKATRS